MQSYASSTKSALRLRETYGNSGVDSNEIYFSPELRQFKQNARESVESLRNYVISRNWDFDLEKIKVDWREKWRFSMATSFSSCMLNERTSKEEKLTENNNSNKFLDVLKKKRVRYFRVTCIFLYIFDYDLQTSNAEPFFKIYDLNNGRYFYINMTCVTYLSLMDYLENVDSNYLICFPRDGSYEVDQELGKVPLSFVSRKPSGPGVLSGILPIALKGIMFFRCFTGQFRSGMLIMGFGSLVEIGVSHYSRSYSTDQIIQLVYNKLERFLRPVSRNVIRIIKNFRPPEQNYELVDNYYKYRSGLNSIKESMLGDVCPYVKTRELVERFFAQKCEGDIKNFISVLNSIALESSTTEIISGKITPCDDENTDFSLESFARNIKKQPRQFNDPGSRLDFSDKPMDDIARSFMSQHEGLRRVDENEYVVELYEGDEKVCVILGIKWGREIIINMKYWKS